MISRSSLTSWPGLAAAVCASLLLAGCGAGDSGQQATQSGTRLLATSTAAAAAPVAPGSIRMHFNRVPKDTAPWGVY